MPGLAPFLFNILLLVINQSAVPFLARELFQRSRSGISLPPSRSSLYFDTIIIVSFQAGFALLIGILSRVPLFGSSRIETGTALLAFGFLVLNVGLVDPVEWKYTSAEVKNRIFAFLPHNSLERLIWIAVSLATALSEEIIFRAVLFGLLYGLTGNYWIAGILSAVFFALNHRKYGWTAVGSTFVVAIVLQWFVKISGGLYISIAVHFLHNYLAILYSFRNSRGRENKDAEAKQTRTAPAI